jgi:hypothetical protein
MNETNDIYLRNGNKNMNNEKPQSFYDLVIKIFNYIWDVGYVVLPSIGYMHQYMKIASLKKTEGFSKNICFILIMSYIFRIFFWIGQHFEKSILFNAIFGVFIQLLLLRICLIFDTKLQNDETLYRFLNLKEFWNWPYFTDYLIFICFITMLITIISLIIGFHNKPYVFILGVITAIIESFSDLPQIYEIYISKNPFTFSYLLLFFWVSGDIFKVSYFFCRETPIQLILCGIFQLTTDIILSLQIIYYRYICYQNNINDLFGLNEEKNLSKALSNELYKSSKNESLINA